MEHYIVGQPIDNILLKDTIINLNKKCKMFPKQKMEIYEKIKSLSVYLKDPSGDLISIVNDAKDSIKKYENDRKSVYIPKSKNDKHDEPIENDKEKEVERIEINKIYLEQICKIIEAMYKDLGEVASDNDKLAWIYKYVFEIPFNHSAAGEDLLKKYNKKSKYFSQKKAEESYSMAGTFKDLCDFACLDNTYCSIVKGKHKDIMFFWNVILTPKGLYYCDASGPWNGEGSFEKQFMLTPKELKTKVKGYSGYSKTEYVYISNKDKL